MANIPALPNASAWGLLALKSGDKSQQAKQLQKLKQESSTIEVPNEIRDVKKARRVKFNLNRERLNLWKGPVHRNRLADQLIFPLRSHAIAFSTSDEAKEAKREKLMEALKQDGESFQGRLYKALAKNSAQSSSTIDKEKEEQLNLARKMSLKVSDQMKQRLHEVALLQKSKIRKRIKSKNYHRRTKRRMMKEFEKDIALLRQNNPKAFAERLLEAERIRAQERASLRHKTGSRFARLQRLRAKYSEEAREAVANMHDQARELMKRRQNIRGEEDDSDSVISDVDISSSEEETDEEESGSDGADDAGGNGNEIGPNFANWWAKVENQPEKSASIEMEENDDSEMATATNQHAPTLLSTLASEEMIRKSTTNGSAKPSDGNTQAGEVLDPTDENFFAALREAVGEGGAVESAAADFQSEKRAVEDEEALKDLDTFLPGWNRWSGPGTEAIDEKLRQKRLIAAPKRKRRDRGHAKVIIREKVNEELRKHLVKKIPFPYATPEQYEQAIGQPISREWTTEVAHRELTKPKVILKAGQVIRPISKDVALLREKDTLRLIAGRRKI